MVHKTIQTRFGRSRAALVACCALAFASSAVSVADAGPVQRDAVFPNFEGQDLQTGKTISLKDLEGKVVLVDFWATWCSPCRHEIPGIKRAYQKYHERGLEIISISLDRRADTAKQFVKREKMNWYHIYDQGNRLSRQYGVRGIPRQYVVGRDGRVISDNARGPELERAIELGLKQKTPEGKSGECTEVQLSEADTLRSEKRYAAAVKLYDEIATGCGEKPIGEQARKRAADMRADPNIAHKLDEAARLEGEQKALQEAEGWLQLARQSAKLGRPDMARRYYRQIIDKYPKTEPAQVAQKELADLPA